MEEKQTNYTIAEGYELPSKGKVYAKPVDAHVDLRSMTARDEMKRLNPSTAQFKVMADIIEGCLIEKPAIHVYDMCLADYEYLLHKLRVVSYGDEYKMAVRCPHCGKIQETVVHLDSLETKEFDLDNLSKYQTFKLPVKGKTISLKLQTPRMLDERDQLVKEFERRFKDADMQFDILAQLCVSIDTIDDEKMSMPKLEAFINALPVKDMRTILNNIERMNDCLGLNTTTIVDCDACGGSIPATFRFGPEFFGPADL